MSKHFLTHIIFDHDGTLVDTTKIKRSAFTGIQDMLKDLHSRGIKLYVWTARDRRSTLEILSSLDMIRYFEGFCTSSDAPGKPNVSGPKEMLGSECDFSKVCMIGDSPADMQGGSELGSLTLGAMWVHGEKSAEKYLKERGADQCFLNVADCHNFLLERI